MHSQAFFAAILGSIATSALAQSLSSTATSYMGCYVDAGSTGTRTLNYAPYTASNNTNEMCQSACFGAGYAYSGSEYGTQCFCGNTLDTSVASDGDCNVACGGAPNEMCGGNWRLTVYSTAGSGAASSTSSTSVTPSSPASSLTFSTSSTASTTSSVASSSITMPSTGAGYLGCYVDTGSTAVRTLNYGAYSYSNNTNEICQSTCASAGYAYSGTEYGIQCFCDNQLSAVPTSDSSCNVACAGSSSEMCGGNWLLSVYSTGVTSGSSASGGMSASTSISSVSSSVSSSSISSSTATRPTSSSVSTPSSPPVTSTSTSAAPTSTTPTTTSVKSSSSSAPSSSASSTHSATPSSLATSAFSTARQSSSSSSSTAAPASATGTSTGYMGCYIDPFALISLNTFTFTSASNTNALCRATCYTKGFAYSATTAGLQCTCSNSRPLAVPAPALLCSVPCPGDWSQSCGGVASYSVYKSH